VATHPAADHRYELAFTAEGKIPAGLEHRVRDRDLVPVRTAYHDNDAAPTRYVGASLRFWGIGADQGWTFPVRAGVTRTEYFTPGVWDLLSHGYYGDLDTLTARGVSLRAATAPRLSWNKAASGPSLRDGPWVDREGDVIRSLVPLFADAAGHPRLPASWADNGVEVGSQTLYREGELVASAPVGQQATFEVPRSEAGYRLVCEVTRVADWWPLSTKVSAAWTFRSSAADNGKPLPLLTVRFSPEVDLRNTAPGNEEFAIPVEVERQAGSAAVASLAVEVSYDDGASWQPAPVTAGKARVRHPASGYVSLRAKAADDAGSTVQLTINRAYQLR
jgi:hypothetical protein